MSIKCVQELQSLVPKLQTQIDHLETWYEQLDKALQQVGFEKGIEGLLSAIDEFEE